MTWDALTAGDACVQSKSMLRANMLLDGLRRLGGRRYGRTAFWYLGVERLVVGVVEPGDDEPLLTACATVTGQAQTPFSAGLLEAAIVADSRGLDHVAALDEPLCTLVAASGDGVATAAPGTSVEMPGPSATLIRADREALEWAVRVFAEARLRLVCVECADVARIRLCRYLGHVSGSPHEVAPLACDADPLAAVSVATQWETQAAELGRLLGVPVGLALGRFDVPVAEPIDGPDDHAQRL
jgi:hypothetical protein